MTLHLLFIILHSISGIAAFIAGSDAILQLNKKSALSLIWIFLWSLLGLDVFMIGAVILDMPVLSKTQMYVYFGLILLGLYMLYRGYNAYLVQKKKGDIWQFPFIEHVGFTLISLFDGFIIVTAIDLGLPVWGVVIIGILGVITGISIINKIKLNLK